MKPEELAKIHEREVFFVEFIFGYLRVVESHFIFENEAGKGRIRHRTTLKLNF